MKSTIMTPELRSRFTMLVDKQLPLQSEEKLRWLHLQLSPIPFSTHLPGK